MKHNWVINTGAHYVLSIEHESNKGVLLPVGIVIEEDYSNTTEYPAALCKGLWNAYLSKQEAYVNKTFEDAKLDIVDYGEGWCIVQSLSQKDTAYILEYASTICQTVLCSNAESAAALIEADIPVCLYAGEDACVILAGQYYALTYDNSNVVYFTKNDEEHIKELTDVIYMLRKIDM